MSEVSPFTIEDLRRDLANLHSNGMIYEGNPYTQLAEHRLMVLISELLTTPHQLMLTTGSSKVEGITTLNQHNLGVLFPPKSIIELSEVHDVSYPDNSTPSGPPKVYGGSSRYLGFSAITKTLAQNGQLHLTSGLI